MGRHSCCHKQKLKKGLWSPEEDDKLIRFIAKHGHGCWSILPKLAGLQRCGKSCRLRWINYLRPDLKRGSFSQQEEDLIIDLHERLGNRWSQIAMSLPGRTDNEIKNFWNSCIKKKLKQSGIDPATHRPLTCHSCPKDDLPSVPKAGMMHQQPGLNPTLWSSRDIIPYTDFDPEWQQDVGSGNVLAFTAEGLPFLRNPNPCVLSGTSGANAAVYKTGSSVATSPSSSSANTIGSLAGGDAMCFCENCDRPISSSSGNATAYGGSSHYWADNGIASNSNIDSRIAVLPFDSYALWTAPQENVWAELELQETMKWHDPHEAAHDIV